KINVEVIGSKPSGSPKGFGRSPTIAFPGAVKTFTPSVFDATSAVTRVDSFSPFLPSIWYSFRSERVTVQGKIGRNAMTRLLDERIDQCRSIGLTRQPGRPQADIRKPLKSSSPGGENWVPSVPVSFPKIDSYSIFYFNCRIRSCRNCRSGCCWVRARAFSYEDRASAVLPSLRYISARAECAR